MRLPQGRMPSLPGVLFVSVVVLVVGVIQGDEVDAASAQFCVNSSLAPVLLFRRRINFVADVLKGIKQHGFTQTGWDALQRYWGAVCRQGPCGPVCTLEPWEGWIPPDLHGFFKWIFDALQFLNDFVKQVVIDRRDPGLHRWAAWLGEDLSARPYAWFRPDFVPPSPFLVIRDPEAQTSRILVEPHLMDAEFRKAWMPFFCRSGHLVVAVDQFLVDPFLPQEADLDLPRISGQDLLDTDRAEKSTAGGLDGWACNEVEALPLPYWCLAARVAGCMYCYESEGSWDSTPLGQRPLGVLPVVYRLWASLRLGHLKEWVKVGSLSLSLVWVMGFLLLKRLRTLRKCWPRLGATSCMFWLQMPSNPLVL